ncbi:hypothetical protein I4F81_004486 [Pyropia yezoensis]|uniref:Uncharacterized protein n=1 Tax=Pyropia yezoensis TaxID=2788 RepID=A0ACC3BVI9_PYRYE|nr:hypothetical protein I4F81_004486 [Neopyropia yezoensis]
MVDARADTYWQSDGPQPHTITGVSPVAARLCQLRLLCDYGADESYTPALLSVAAGSHWADLQPVRSVVSLVEPVGWVVIDLAPPEG